MTYPAFFLLPADVLCWWHLEDTLWFGQVTASKPLACDSGQPWWWALAEVSLLVKKALWCWAVPSRLVGEVYTPSVMAGR